MGVDSSLDAVYGGTASTYLVTAAGKPCCSPQLASIHATSDLYGFKRWVILHGFK